MGVKDDILSIEGELWTGDADAYHRNVDDDCLVAFTEMAGVWSREQVAGSVEEGARWRDVEMDVEGFLRPQPDVAFLTYRARAVRGEGADEERYRALVTSGYVDRDGRWKMVFHQQTPLGE